MSLLLSRNNELSDESLLSDIEEVKNNNWDQTDHQEGPIKFQPIFNTISPAPTNGKILNDNNDSPRNQILKPQQRRKTISPFRTAIRPTHYSTAPINRTARRRNLDDSPVTPLIKRLCVPLSSSKLENEKESNNDEVIITIDDNIESDETQIKTNTCNDIVNNELNIIKEKKSEIPVIEESKDTEQKRISLNDNTTITTEPTPENLSPVLLKISSTSVSTENESPVLPAAENGSTVLLAAENESPVLLAASPGSVAAEKVRDVLDASTPSPLVTGITKNPVPPPPNEKENTVHLLPDVMVGDQAPSKLSPKKRTLKKKASPDNILIEFLSYCSKYSSNRDNRKLVSKQFSVDGYSDLFASVAVGSFFLELLRTVNSPEDIFAMQEDMIERTGMSEQGFNLVFFVSINWSSLKNSLRDNLENLTVDEYSTLWEVSNMKGHKIPYIARQGLRGSRKFIASMLQRKFRGILEKDSEILEPNCDSTKTSPVIDIPSEEEEDSDETSFPMGASDEQGIEFQSAESDEQGQEEDASPLTFQYDRTDLSFKLRKICAVTGDSLKLYSHQQDCIKKAIRNESFIVAHEAGLGKTVTLISSLVKLAEVNNLKDIKVLISVPKATLGQWEATIMKWVSFKKGYAQQVKCSNRYQDFYSKMINVDGLGFKSEGKDQAVNRFNIILTTPKSITLAFQQAFKKGTEKRTWLRRPNSRNHLFLDSSFDVFAIDEVHMMRNPFSQQSVAHQHIAKRSRYRFGLTGTPVMNSALDMVGLCRSIALGGDMEKKEFWCKSGKKTVNHEAIHKLKRFMDRRTELDDGIGLPPLHITKRHYPLIMDNFEDIEKYNSYIQEFHKVRKEMKQGNTENNRSEVFKAYHLIFACIRKLGQSLTSMRLADIGAQKYWELPEHQKEIVDSMAPPQEEKKEDVNIIEDINDIKDSDFDTLEQQLRGMLNLDLDNGDKKVPDSKSSKGNNKAVSQNKAFDGSFRSSMNALCEVIEEFKSRNILKIVVACNSLAPLDICKQYIEKYKQHYGSVHEFSGRINSMEERERVVSSFLDPNEPDSILLLSIQAGGTGLHLVPGCNALIFWGDLPWSPLEVKQCYKRVHRIGQTEEVFIVMLYPRGSITEALGKLHDDKMKLFELIANEDKEASKNTSQKDGYTVWKQTGDILSNCWIMTDNGLSEAHCNKCMKKKEFLEDTKSDSKSCWQCMNKDCEDFKRYNMMQGYTYDHVTGNKVINRVGMTQADYGIDRNKKGVKYTGPTRDIFNLEIEHEKPAYEELPTEAIALDNDDDVEGNIWELLGS